MMRRLISLFSLLVMMAAPVAAKEAPIDPLGAYILVEVQNLDDAFMKGTKAPGVLTFARYDPIRADIRGGHLSPETAPPAGDDVRVTLSKKPVMKSKAARLYLVKVVPDTWIVEGANGTAFSLGSMSFAIAPGQIVDLGVMKPSIDWAEGEKPKSRAAGLIGAMLFGSFAPKEQRPVRIDWHKRGVSDIAMPSVLAGRSVTAVQFAPNHKFGNYLGGLVNRFGGRSSRPGASPQTVSADTLSNGSQ
ncbi:hypothetical protein [Rhizorhapis suberifaciens]|uniref:Uncharacterized protein n=1 Tax=Rhizorhapis suberifaciens TaxID=13656 RepID=A0A840HQ65_9SPHN|nr:hypothetical protein [Rhizorhapis suberifaciens]MBB4640003.1 hypothetical protein [Rhizorhapis suberifaciens]